MLTISIVRCPLAGGATPREGREGAGRCSSRRAPAEDGQKARQKELQGQLGTLKGELHVLWQNRREEKEKLQHREDAVRGQTTKVKEKEFRDVVSKLKNILSM